MGKKVDGNDVKKVKGSKSVSTKLLRVLIPIIAIDIMIIMAVVATSARKIITQLAQDSLQSESQYYAEKVGREITNLQEYLDSNADTLGAVSFSDDDAMARFLLPTMSKNQYVPNGMYLATSDGDWIDPSGWVPDPDYVPTERDWYKRD